MNSALSFNKQQVIRFNQECIAGGSLESFHELVSDQVINHSAQPGMSKGRDGMIYFLFDILRKAFPDVKVTILNQVAEGDWVATRKEISGTHTGEFLGIAATGKPISIKVMDFIRLENGLYMEHWGMSNIPELLAALQEAQPVKG